MHFARQWIVCCTAIALVLAALPAPVAVADEAPPGPTPCHSDGEGPALHDVDCAMGCDSLPVPDQSVPDWAPSPSRGGQDLPDPVGCLSAHDLVPRPPTRSTTHWHSARAPPTLRGATPVARHDILRD